jgi:hypothetical protein
MEKKQEEQNTIHYHPLCQTRRQIPSTQNEGRSGDPKSGHGQNSTHPPTTQIKRGKTLFLAFVRRNRKNISVLMNKANSKDLPTTLEFTTVLDVVAEMQGAYAPFIDKINFKF